MDTILAPRHHRISKLGKLGELLAEEALKNSGFTDVINLNQSRPNQPYADLQAERNGHRYFIGVKTRNEKTDIGALNESYNCVLVSDRKNRILKADGKNVQEITQMALKQVGLMASEFDALPAWVAVAIRPLNGTYAVYFGTLDQLGNRRSIPMRHSARQNYECLVEWAPDERITPDLGNHRG